MTNPSVFDGDGRQAVDPVNAPAGTHPLRVTRAAARSLIAAFESHGVSYHSANGGTLWIIITHCIEQGIPYQVREHVINGGVAGYEVKKL